MTEQTAQQPEQPVFRMQKMYIKDFSFESPGAPKVFLAKNQNPKVDFNLQLKNGKIDGDHWEVSIAITAKVLDKNNEDTVMFIVELEHAAVFLLQNIPQEHHARILAVDCPLMLFPFTRQIVSQVAVDGGFMPFLMEPINFVALYDNAQKQKQDS
ncbi:protein-export chaperone SecB [Desulfobulbus alkaliphilus]|uniref:protein-export chaperone SecB n=1 Tax=Desulfobulbus alkaliphilus TaxID=869814 RepID=UPI0019633CA5|nr:protein-export chaperone SecB [Desulfobulbus alkaliphilus]MBM9538298.1 protein-export chaperone SecB [Desulfobulbus alkaliphilus]